MDYDDSLTYITERYANQMQSYLANPCPTALQTARELGNLAINHGINFREIGKLYQKTLVEYLETCDNPQSYLDVTCRAKDFLTHSLFPFQKQSSTFAEESFAVSQADTMKYDEDRETDLSQSREFLQLVIDNIPQAIFWKDRESRYLGCNRLFAEDAGLSSPQDIIGKNDWNLPWSKEAHLYRSDDLEVMDSSVAKLNIEEPMTKANGMQAWLRTNKAPLHNQQGEVVGILGTYEDITLRKQAEAQLNALGQKLEERIEKRTQQLKQINQQLLDEIARRQQTEIELRHSEEKFRQLAENIQSIFWIRAVEGHQFGELLYVSPGYYSVWDRPPNELYASPESFLSAIYPEDYEAVAKFISIPSSESYDQIYRIVRLDGEIRWLHSRAFPVFNAQGELYRVAGICEDITQQKTTEQELQASLTKKELLIKEIQHRVKNNLQIVCSLLQLQAKSLPKCYRRDDLSSGGLESAIAKDDNQSLIAQVFKESQQRIFTMALLYEHLYSSDDLSQINLAKYLQDLVSYLFQSYEIRANSIQLQLQIEPIELNIETAIPCGLIVNELITNILQHAFPNHQKGKVNLHCTQTQERRFCLTIEDDGIGLSAEIDPLTRQSLGFRIVRMLADQIDGDIAILCNSGTKIQVDFSELNYEPRF